MQIFIGILLMIITGIIMLVLFFMNKPICKKLAEKEKEITDSCPVYDAVVLDEHMEDVTDKDGRTQRVRALILQFEKKEQHCTMVHRYILPFKRSYARGDMVRLYFGESPEGDTALLENDNPLANAARTIAKLRIVTLIIGIGAFAAGIMQIVTLIIGIGALAAGIMQIVFHMTVGTIPLG